MECPSLLSLLQLCLVPLVVYGHGRLIDPPSRSTMWRYGFKTPPNYNDNQLYCGGTQVQYETNGGKCGVCGDPWNGARENEPPGKYANGIVVRKYSPGQVITIVIELTANHKGYMEFKICPNDDPSKTVTQQCLDRHVLPMADSKTTTKYLVPNENGYQKLRIKVRLPSNIRCKDCVLQWKYNAGNSWGVDSRTGRGCVGCGNQEQFYGCADVAVGYPDTYIAPHKKPLPADIDENEDGSHPPTIIPPIREWHWTARPNEIPNMDNDHHDWDTTDMEKQSQQRLPAGSFNFMPVMNQNGMNPCMCVCKRAPLKMKGGADNNIEVKFFDGMEGQDNQVCMCMCQSDAVKVKMSIWLNICACLFVLMYSYLLRRQ